MDFTEIKEMWKIPNSYFYGKDKINNIGEKKIIFP
jgi:hypothetical protein